MSPSSAGKQRRSLPRSGSPLWGAFLFGHAAGSSGAIRRVFFEAPREIPTAGALADSAERCAGIPGTLTAGPRSSGKKRSGRTGRKVSRRLTPCARPCGRSRAVIAAGLRRWAIRHRSRSGAGRTALPFGPAPRSTQVVHGGKASRPPGKERLFTSGACHLRAFGLWKLVHRSTLRQRPGVPGNALRRIFRCLPVMGPGRRQAGLQGLGRCGRSQPFWRIEKWLTSA